MKSFKFCSVFVLLLCATSGGTPSDWREFILELENELEIDRYLKVIIPPPKKKIASVFLLSSNNR